MQNVPTSSAARRLALPSGDASGFSIIEMLVVLTVMAIMTAIAVPQLMRAFDRSRQRRTMADMRSISGANGAYHLDNRVYAAVLSDLTPDYLNPAPGADAWGNALVYSGAGASYTLTSYGQDGAAGPAPPTPWTAEPFEPDMIIVNGMFTQAPSAQ